MLPAISSTYSTAYSLYGSAYNQYGALSAIGGATSVSTLGSVGRVSSLSQQSSSYQVKLSNYGKLQSALDTFKGALGNFKSAQDVAPFKVTSSATDTLTAKASGDASAASYSVKVTQLAKAQTLTSRVYADKDSTIVGTGTITLQTGSYNADNNTFSADSKVGSKTISIYASDGTLSGIAKAINAAGANVKASVVQASGGYQLSLTSTQSGTDNTIKLGVSDNDATNADLAGLSALAYDPTAGPSGYNKNLTETVAAQNAQLTVDGTSFSSQSNTVTGAAAGVTFALAATGSATVSVARDSEAFGTSAQKFVDAYNALQKTISGISGGTATSAEDGVVARVSNELLNTEAKASTGYGLDQTTLANLGISRQSDNTLTLDKTRLQAAFAANPENASKLIASAATSLSTTATRLTASSSELKVVSRGLNRALQNVQNQYLIQQSSSSQNYFGLPVSQSQLSDYIPKFNTQAMANRYAQISALQ